MKRIKAISPYCILLLIMIMLFWELPKTFYQQDEWLALGNIKTYGWEYIFLGTQNALDLLLGEGRIASRFITYFILGGFPFNLSPLTAYGVLFHAINTFLVYRLVNQFLKYPLYSLIGASFFAVNSVSHQAVTWQAAVIGTLTATTLLLLSLFAFFRFLGGYNFTKKNTLKGRWLLASLILIYISLHFKETGIFLVLFLPLVAFIVGREFFYSKIRFFIAIAFPFVIIVAYRILELRLRTTESNLFLTGLQENFFIHLALRAILYPLTSFSLMFVPGDHFLSFARSIMKIQYPFLAKGNSQDLIVQTIVLDLLAVLLSMILAIVLYLLLRRERRESKSAVIFWIAFSLFGFLPYIVLSKDFSYLESRYYYFPVVGGAFLLGWTLKRVREHLGEHAFLKAGLIVLAILYLLIHASVVKSHINHQVDLGNERRNLITQLKHLVPTLVNKRNVFFTAGNKEFYATGNYTPLQQGIGYTLMLLYNESEKIPIILFKDEFLFEIGGQGYKEIGEFGFGHFSNEEELNKAAKHYGFSKESVIRLYYDSQTKRLTKLK